MYKPGDHSRAICSHCQKIVTTTFQRRDLVLTKTERTLHDILVAVCDECGETVAVPASSTEANRKQTC